jgi:hypothetical protein
MYAAICAAVIALLAAIWWSTRGSSEPRDELARAAAAAPAPAAAPESAPAAPLPPKDAQGELVVHVVQAANQLPIPDAEVRLFALRRSDEPGSSYAWPEGAPGRAKTDSTGTATLRYPA